MKVVQGVGLTTWSRPSISISEEVIIVTGNYIEIEISGIRPGQVGGDDIGKRVEIVCIFNLTIVVSVVEVVGVVIDITRS